MFNIPNSERLVKTARRAALKMKIEYDRLHPDAPREECWAEQQRLVEALEDFDVIYPDANTEVSHRHD